MRIGDAAAAAGTTPRALRFYEQRGLLDSPEYMRDQDVRRRTLTTIFSGSAGGAV